MPDFTSLSFYKIALIGGLAIATIVPNLFISNLVEERETRQDGVRQEFTRNWGPEQNLYSPTLVIPYQAGERPRTIRQDRAGAARPCGHAQSAGAPARPVPARPSTTPTLDMQGAFVVPAEARLREFVADKDGRFIWNEAAIAFGAGREPHRAALTDNITVDGTPTAMDAVPRSAAPGGACRAPTLVLANAPLPLAARGQHARAVQVGASACAAPARSRCSSRRQGAVGDVPLVAGRRRASAATRCRSNSTVSADGFEANWQTTEFGSPRITTVHRDHGCRDVERRDHRRST